MTFPTMCKKVTTPMSPKLRTRTMSCQRGEGQRKRERRRSREGLAAPIAHLPGSLGLRRRTDGTPASASLGLRERERARESRLPSRARDGVDDERARSLRSLAHLPAFLPLAPPPPGAGFAPLEGPPGPPPLWTFVDVLDIPPPFGIVTLSLSLCVAQAQEPNLTLSRRVRATFCSSPSFDVFASKYRPDRRLYQR